MRVRVWVTHPTKNTFVLRCVRHTLFKQVTSAKVLLPGLKSLETNSGQHPTFLLNFLQTSWILIKKRSCSFKLQLKASPKATAQWPRFPWENVPYWESYVKRSYNNLFSITATREIHDYNSLIWLRFSFANNSSNQKTGLWERKAQTLPILLTQTCATTPTSTSKRPASQASSATTRERHFIHPTEISQLTTIQVDWCVCGSELQHLLAAQRQLVAFVARYNKQNHLTPDLTMEGCVWYGIVCQHYLWTFCFLGLCEEMLCHRTRFNFLWIPPKQQRGWKAAEMLLFCWKSGGWMQTKALRIIELQLFVKFRPWEA